MVGLNITENGAWIARPVRATFHRKSIMADLVRKEWTVDGAFELPANFDISDGDKACVRALDGL